MVSSNKSAKTIKSLTKQVKNLKKLASALQAHQEDSDANSSLSSVEGDMHFQYACAAIATTHPEVAMALKSHKARDLDLRSVWLLDNQSNFDLCCNPDFVHKRRKAKRAMHMSSNGGGLHISKKCEVLGYDFWVWFTKRAMTNILCLKNLIRLYWVTYDRIASGGRHSLCTGRNLVFLIWPLICILVDCTFNTPKRLMDNMVLSKLLLTI